MAQRSIVSMSSVIEEVTLRLPRESLMELTQLSAPLNDRMHALLERNTDDLLSKEEKDELERLVEMAHFGQILALSLQPRAST